VNRTASLFDNWPFDGLGWARGLSTNAQLGFVTCGFEDSLREEESDRRDGTGYFTPPTWVFAPRG
jgi:hypothetical protein